MGGRDVLPIKRFGRDKTDYGYTRSRMISALTVLLADEAPGTRSRWSYVLLVEEWRRIVAEPENSTHELFRRMCFNALISNLDDHPRNHVFIAKDQDWALSPALRFESFASCQPGAPRSCDGVRGPEHLLRKRKNDVRAGIKMPENMRQAFVRFKTLCDDILGYSKKALSRLSQCGEACCTHSDCLKEATNLLEGEGRAPTVQAPGKQNRAGFDRTDGRIHRE